MSESGSRRLRFLEQLGEGAFGTVYLGELSSPSGLRQRVAIKVMRSGGGQGAGDAARHRDEARLLSLLNHDHIVKVHDFLDVGGQPAFTLEYVEGVNAEQLVATDGALPPRAALRVGVAVAGALERAYNAQHPETGQPLRVIHRDIKPANVLVSVGGGVKVLDFGVARADFDRDAETRSEHPGTVIYMAPECFTGGEVGAAADTYALGLTLIRLLTGEALSRLVANEQRFERQREELLQRVRSRLPEGAWQEAMIATLRAMLAWNAEERPTGAALHDGLMALEDGAPGERLESLCRRRVAALLGAQRERRRARAPSLPADLALSESDALTPGTLPAAPRARVFALAAGGLLGGALLGIVLLAAIGLWAWREWSARREPMNAPAAVVLAPEREASTAETPPPTEAAPPAEEPPSPSPRPRAARAASAPAARTTVILNSIPFGATIWIDGKEQGVTPRSLELTDGTHALRLKLTDGRYTERTLTVGPLYPTRITWHVDQGSWSSSL